MKTRSLGTSNIQVVPLMLGGNVFGWTVDQPTSFRLLDHFVDHGFNFIDTADVYSRWLPGNKGGESETILGNWFSSSGKRDRVVLATKVGMDLGDGKQGLSKRYILEAVEASLKRLQTDRIDLYQSHKDDPSVPIEETLEAYQILIDQGKVRMIGASNYTPERLTAALEASALAGLPAYQTLQPEYNLYTRESYETGLAPLAAKYKLGVVPYFSLAAGFLTGKYKTLADTKGKARGKGIEKYFDARGERILKALAQVAEETSAQQSSVALAWLLAQPTITAPIASATTTEQMDSLFAAVALKLSKKQLKALTEASAY
jgi:aryl-alcohol dehydrogenase-like predicted oxidoreductase